MRTRSLTVLDFRDEGWCEHCFLDRLKKAYDERYVACQPEYELLIVTPEQASGMQRIAASPGLEGVYRLDSWWGVPLLVQEA